MVNNTYKAITRAFPQPFKIGRKLVIKRSDFERFKLAVAADAAGVPVPDYTPPDIESFLTLDNAAKEMDVDRRTVDRLLRVQRNAAA